MQSVTQHLPSFSTERERQLWFAEHAEYFTVIRRRAGRNERHEFPTMKTALAGASVLLNDDPHARFLIYAVWGPSDHYITTVHL